MKQIKKNKKVGDVCIRERGDPAREADSGVTSHSSHAAGASDNMNTQRGIGGRQKAGSYRAEHKGSILSVTAVKMTTAVSLVDFSMYSALVRRVTSASLTA